MSASDYVHLDGVDILRVTDNAVLLALDGEQVWIPLSHVAREDRDGLAVGEGWSLAITKWIADQKGIDA